MPDYKEMYLNLMRASENAIRVLIEAQQKCEELYLTDEETLIRLPSESNQHDRGSENLGTDCHVFKL